MKAETVEERALTIAARVLEADGVCRYDDPVKCRRVFPPEPEECAGCIRRWLLSKAKKELKKEGAIGGG